MVVASISVRACDRCRQCTCQLCEMDEKKTARKERKEKKSKRVVILARGKIYGDYRPGTHIIENTAAVFDLLLC